MAYRSARTLPKAKVREETENAFVVIDVNQLIISTSKTLLLNSVLYGCYKTVTGLI